MALHVVLKTAMGHKHLATASHFALMCSNRYVLRMRLLKVVPIIVHLIVRLSGELGRFTWVRTGVLNVHKLYGRFGGEFGLFRSRHSVAVILFDLDAFTSHKSTVVKVTVTRWLRLAILGAGFNLLLNLGSLIAVLKHFETPPSMCL